MLGLDPIQFLDVDDIDGRLVTLRALKDSLDPEKGFAADHAPQPVEGGLGNKEVGDACLVFERNEAMPLRGAWSLTADDHPRDGDRNAVWKVLQISGT